MKQKKKMKTKSKAVIIGSVVLAVCAAGCGIWYYLGHRNTDPIYVYPFQYVGMTEFWGDSQESYGPVTTDKIQTIFLTDTQTVTEICVKDGQEVKKGDLLMTFDTTLTGLALERKRLEVEKLKLQLKDAQDELKTINGMEPMEVPGIPDLGGGDEEEADPGRPLGQDFEVSTNPVYDGSAPEKALICWIGTEKTMTNRVFDEIYGAAVTFQTQNAVPKDPSSASALPEEEAEAEPAAEPETEPATEPETEPATEPATEPETEPATEPETELETEPATEPATEPETEPVTEPATEPETEPDESEPEETEPDTPDVTVAQFYVVLKTTQGDTAWGAVTNRQGLRVEVLAGGGYGFSFFDASVVPDHYPEPPELNEGGTDLPSFDIGSGMTAAQIAEARKELTKKITDLTFDVKMAEAAYKIMETEMSDGNIYATIDGSVVSVLTEEDAKRDQQPIIKVSGGGGFYVEGSVSELSKDQLKIGQEVDINDWRNGQNYKATVKSIGDFPSMNDSWNGMGNPNASYYPFQVFVDETADLQEGSYVSLVYSAGTSENGVYLENAFVRKEQGRSYVMIKGADGRLEQRYVTTGKSLWGSYTEILSGLTAEDMIAFPYGKNLKVGAVVEEGDLSNLYG